MGRYGLPCAFIMAFGVSLHARLLPHDLRWRAITELRTGLAADAFWPAMHAAEGLTEAGFGPSVAFDLRPRLDAESDAQRRCGLAREIARTGDLAPVRTLADILADAVGNGRIHAAESLFKIGQTGPIERLRAAAADGDPVLALMAAAALLRAGDGAYLAPIRMALQHQEMRVRRTAAWLLGQVGSAADIAALRPLAARETDAVALAFVWNALAALGAPEAPKIVVANLGAAHPDIRAHAAHTLGLLGRPEDLGLLEKALDDEALDVRIRAGDAIMRITDRMLGADADGDGIPDIIERELGTPADDPEVLVPFFAAAAEGPGQADPETLPPELTGAWFGHAGADRYVWVYAFGAAVSELGTVFHSTVWLDGDDATGRQDGDARGVDVVYSFQSGRCAPRIFTPDRRVRHDWPVRGVVAGSRIYVCDDVRPLLADGQAAIEVDLLSERHPNARTAAKSGRRTGRTVVTVARRQDRPVPRLPFAETAGFD